jgi:hypothetical protein
MNSSLITYTMPKHGIYDYIYNYKISRNAICD